MPRSISVLSGKFLPVPLTSLDVEKLTGLTQIQIRDWRRRGLLQKPQAGRPSYDAFDVAEIALRRALNQLGVQLSDTEILAREAAPLVVAEVCLRTSRADNDLQEELELLLADAGDIIFVEHSVHGTASAVPMYSDLLLDDLVRKPTKMNSVWGVVSLKAVANSLYVCSTRPLVTFSPSQTGGNDD